MLLFNLNYTIMKTLHCRDVGFDCDKEIHAETEEAVLAQAADHALRVHNVNVTPEMADHIRGLIKEEASADARGR
jgi:predicted small metal-binding protein